MSVEAEMETEENGEKRKRPLDKESKEESPEGTIKRSNVADAVSSMQVKFLVPAAAAGALIGKSGEAIAALQKDTGTKLKMSKSNDFFPGTTERVVLAVGSLSAIKNVLEFVTEKLKDKCDPGTKLDMYDCRNVDRSREVKIVIANSTAGMIIGKAGEYIKTIKEQTGAFIQISPGKQQAAPSWVSSSKKHEPSSLTERVVTIVGSVDELSSALDMVLAKVAADPNSVMNSSVSYADFTVSSATCDSRSPFSSSSSSSFLTASCGGRGVMPPQSFMFTPGLGGIPKAPGASSGCRSPSQQFLPAPLSAGSGGSGGIGNLQVLQFLENLQATLRSSGYSELAVSEIMQAMQILTKHNVLGLGLGFGLAAVGSIGGGNGGGSPPPSNNGGPFPTANSSAGGSFYNFFKSSPDTSSSPNFIGAAGRQPPFVGGGGRPGLGAGAVGSGGGGGGKAGGGYDTPMADLNELVATAAAAGGGGLTRSDVFGLDLDHLTSEFRYGERMSLEEDGGGVNYAASIIKVFSDEPNKLQLEVPENIVGAVLGKQGKTLLDIQHFTGAKVEVSKRGSYAPGTQNRIVTISGTPDSIRNARVLAERSINREQMRRDMRQQNTGT